MVIINGSKLLTDGCLDARKHAKHLFAELVQHSKFEQTMKKTLSENEQRDIKKTLDSLKPSHLN